MLIYTWLSIFHVVHIRKNIHKKTYYIQSHCSYEFSYQTRFYIITKWLNFFKIKTFFRIRLHLIVQQSVVVYFIVWLYTLCQFLQYISFDIHVCWCHGSIVVLESLVSVVMSKAIRSVILHVVIDLRIPLLV